VRILEEKIICILDLRKCKKILRKIILRKKLFCK